MKATPFLLATIIASASLHAAEPIVVADFESETYGDWKVEGDAFGKVPARGKIGGQMNVEGFRGKGLVNSFNGGDGAPGRLTSPAFKVERKYLRFLIGGGGGCMNLLVDGKAVRTATRTNTKPGGSEMVALDRTLTVDGKRLVKGFDSTETKFTAAEGASIRSLKIFRLKSIWAESANRNLSRPKHHLSVI